MKSYVVTFYWQEDNNNKEAIAIRTILEKMSPDKWIQIFPNQVTIQSDLSIAEIKSELMKVSSKVRISIFSFDEYSVFPEPRFELWLDEKY